MNASPLPADTTDSELADGTLLAASRVILRPKKARPFFGRHPWVLDTAIDRVEGSPRNGDVVDLLTDRGQFVARGIYNASSKLRVRLYNWSPIEQLDVSFWRRKLTIAGELRQQLGLDAPQGAVRLCSSEGDGLSGLVIERYASQIVMQVLSCAMAQRLNELVGVVAELWKPQGITLRVDREMSKYEGIQLDEGVVWGQLDEGPIFFEEHGLRFGVDLQTGQKTGFYLDQRENRRVTAALVGGRRVLDMCCYTGGFALAAARTAREVWAVDSSARSLALARGNAALNGIANIHFQEADCFKRLEELRQSGERFGLVVLDPPKFASNRRNVDDAMQAYHRLNRLAVEVLEPGGYLVTCSCSGHVHREDLLYMLAGVAEKTGRFISVLEQRGAALDHPVNVSCLESEYLKCFVCRVQ